MNISDVSRRRFLTSLGALGAGALLSKSELSGQGPGGTVRRIDTHHHFGSPEWIAITKAKQTAGWETWQPYTPTRAVESMDMGETQMAFISITTPGIWFGNIDQTRRLARQQNEYGARMVSDFKGRFGLLAVLPLPDVEASLREIEYAYDTLKAEGIGLLTSWSEKWLGDPQFRPVLQELNRRNAAIFTHGSAPSCCGGNWMPGVGETTIEYNTDVSRTIISLISSGAANETPNIRYMMSHGGGTIIGLSGRFLGNEASAENLAKTPAPNSKLHHLRRFYYDTPASSNPIIIGALKQLVGAQQILFGTDHPFGNSAAMAAAMRTVGLTAEEMRGVNRENALRIFPKYRT
jgi:predicted TIM-barrel fold metal-dependent hydrolase